MKKLYPRTNYWYTEDMGFCVMLVYWAVYKKQYIEHRTVLGKRKVNWIKNG